jgi:hypothetical protein
VGPRAGLDAVVKRKIPIHCWDSNTRSTLHMIYVPGRLLKGGYLTDTVISMKQFIYRPNFVTEEDILILSSILCSICLTFNNSF